MTGSSEPDHQVPGYLVISLLAILAINSAMQPGGRICGVPARYRGFLSISPILYTFDAVLLFSSTVVLRVCGGIDLTEAAYTQTEYWYKHVAPTQSRSREMHREKLIAQEWFTTRRLFAASFAFLASLKLVSISGNPWTKLWGGMFWWSFLYNELVWFAARLHQPETNKTKPKNFTRWLEIFEAVACIAGDYVQAGIFLWAYTSAWSPLISLLQESLYGPYIRIMMLSITMVIIIFLALLYVFLVCTERTHIDDKFHVTRWLARSWAAFVIIAIYFPVINNSTSKEFETYRETTEIFVTAWLWLLIMFWACNTVSRAVFEQWPVVAQTFGVQNSQPPKEKMPRSMAMPSWVPDTVPRDKVRRYMEELSALNSACALGFLEAKKCLAKAEGVLPESRTTSQIPPILEFDVYGNSSGSSRATEPPSTEAAIPARACLLFVLANIVICVAWYLVRYNPANTVNGSFSEYLLQITWWKRIGPPVSVIV